MTIESLHFPFYASYEYAFTFPSLTWFLALHNGVGTLPSGTASDIIFNFFDFF